MSILYLLIPISLMFVGGAIAVFIWAIRNGQFEDLEGPAFRILMDDDDPLIPTGSKIAKSAEDDDKSATDEGAQPRS
ncbi:MAG: cbb3-type cytochrome oxidase assembly protein CcoS [Gammaproteobacteria bacterium]|jgi:cbb3-type cytochrome oxidase maturation protein